MCWWLKAGNKEKDAGKPRALEINVLERLKQRSMGGGYSLQQTRRLSPNEAWDAVEKFQEGMRRSGRTFSDSAILIRQSRDS